MADTSNNATSAQTIPEPGPLLLQWQSWHRSEAARYVSGDPNNIEMALQAVRWLTHRPTVAADYLRVAEGGRWGTGELDIYDRAKAKQLVRDEEEHYRAVVRFLAAFASPYGIDASPLLAGPDEQLTLRIESAIQAALARRRGGTEATDPPPAGRERSKAERATSDPKRRISKSEAEVLVREWLAVNAKANPLAVTRDQVAAATGVSTGMVSATAAWKAFQAKRKANKTPTERQIPLSDEMLAVLPADCQTPQELAALREVAQLYRQQKEESAEQERRHKRRHGPS
jgi:hypothetical protein